MYNAFIYFFARMCVAFGSKTLPHIFVTRMTPGHEQIYIQQFRMQLVYTHNGITFLTVFRLPRITIWKYTKNVCSNDTQVFIALLFPRKIGT